MHPTAGGSNTRLVPKRRQRHHSDDESVDTPPKLIADEAADVEAEHPAEENEPIERVEPDDAYAPRAFEEE